MGRRAPALPGLATLALLACEEPPAPAPAGPPRRIVSLAPSVTELLFALGTGDRVVGGTRFCDYPPEAAGLPRVGGYTDPSVEAVAGLKPDLVLAVPSPANRRPVEALRRLGLSVEIVSDRRLADVRQALATVGDLLGRQAAARAAVARLDAGLDTVRRRVAGRPRPSVLLVYGHRPLVVAAAGSWAGELLAIAGGDNVVAGDGYPLRPLEQVLADAPAVIVDVAMAPAGSRREEAVRFWTRWPSLPAVRDGRVHVLNGGALMRPGPRAPEAAAALARVLHPEASR